jgi:AbrB family looped-hinge helix DNA binding protein
MRTTIDRAGRVVVPRELRAAVGLEHGGSVEIELDGAGIRIEPVSGSEVREEDGLLVIPASGTPVNAPTVRSLIDADRNRR